MSFTNPYAFWRSKERLVEPSHDIPRASALPGDDAYECPACQGELRLAKGKVLPPYFAHNSGQGDCTEAEVLLATAKLLLVQVINDWINGRGAAPRITRHCDRCRRLKIVQPPEDTAQAMSENAPGPQRNDVTLLDGVGRVLLGLQVRVRHRADAHDGPWIEVVGSEVLKDPLFWRPVDWGNLEPLPTCEHCEREAAAGFQTTAPLNPYVVADTSLAGKIFGPGGLMSKSMPGYEERPSQRELAEAIDQTIQKGGNLLAEGPCGTGKSAAYLSIAISHVAHTGGKVLVSTANKALMDQLIDKDLPQTIKALGVNVSYALIKGRGNYACPTRLEQWIASEGDRDHPVADWAITTPDGDIERANVVIEPKVAREIKGKTDCSKHCKADNCFYYQAKERAAEAQVIVTNHSMLFAHLAIKSRIGKAVVLPDVDIVIMDEGHELADSARGFFETTISEGYSSRVAFTDSQRRAIDHTEEQFFRHARRATAKTGGNICEPWLNGQAKSACEDFIDATAGNAVLTKEALERAQAVEADEKTLEELELKHTRAMEVAARVLAVCELLPHKAAGSDRAFWLEDSTNNRRGVSRGVIKGCPVDVSQFIHDGLFAERSVATIVTSATLSTSGNFDHVGKELGFRGDTKQVSSPFDFDRQSILVVPDRHDMPHEPRGQGRQPFLERAADLFSWIATQTGGGVLFLFASKKSMHTVAKRVGNSLPFKVLVQGDDTTKRLSEEFKLDQNACLFGLKSFWAGLDVPGHSLRCVIVEKLPFIAPDEPFQHYRQRVHGRNVAMDYMIQDAMLQLRQGVGRLVRTSSDGGAVVMLDRRVVSRYMREFSASMPWSRRHDGLGVIQGYFAPARA